MKRQRWTSGAVLEVPLGGGTRAYAQMLESPEYAFFDAAGASPISPEAAVERPVLFRLWVMARAHTQGRWRKIGTAPISAALRQKMPRFKQDPLNPDSLSITHGGTAERPASRDECRVLERAAVWDPEHVEDRLRDWLAGRPNKWVLSLCLK
jgi:hypothetical protein